MRRLVLAALGVAACAHSESGANYQQPRDVVAVALAGEVVYAWQAGRFVAWNVSQPVARPRPIDLGRPVGLVEDGSVAVTATHDGRRTRLDVWALGTRMRTYTRTFDDGVGVLGVSRASVALCVMLPQGPDGSGAINALPTDHSYRALWQLAPNTVAKFGGDCDTALAMSPDGERSVSRSFGLTWTDRAKQRARFMDLAPDWSPPDPPTRPAGESPGKPSYVPYPYDILSLRLGAGGSDVYVTYCGTDDGKGWRLERWTPEAPADEASPWRQGSITRLASTDRGRGRLLAVSPDGSLLVLGDDGAALTVRRAPRYEPERLVGDAMTVAATAAVLSRDGARLVTGHADGRLVLWDVRSGRPLATVSP